MARRRLSANHKAAIARSLRGNRNGQGNAGSSRARPSRVTGQSRVLVRARHHSYSLMTGKVRRLGAGPLNAAERSRFNKGLAVNMAVGTLGTAGAMYIANKPLGPMFNGKVAKAGRFGKSKGVFNVTTGSTRKANVFRL